MSQTVILHGATRRQMAKRLIDQAPTGAVVEIKPARRSSEQNAKMWAMLSDISRAKPQGRDMPPELWKCLFMAACGHQVRFEPSLDGQGVVPLGFRSSRLSKDQMSELIECITAYAAEHGVPLGDELREEGRQAA